jgi:ribonucleotide monophosphatase NagD (HAD superfamily)
VGSEGLAVPLMDNGCDLFDVQSSTGVADVVVVGAARQYDTIVINAACEAVLNGSPLYATVDAPWFHGGVGRSVAISAAVAAAISWVTGVRPIVLGKPSAALASILLDKLDVPATDVSVVGDATTELELARHMGANSILVLSGATSQEDVSTLDDASHPDLVLDDIASLFRLRESIRAKEHPHV